MHRIGFSSDRIFKLEFSKRSTKPEKKEINLNLYEHEAISYQSRVSIFELAFPYRRILLLRFICVNKVSN